MGSCREILTLQLGSYSNYVGSHLWSLQELEFSYNKVGESEICHDVLFREGLNLRNEVTFTPRVICVEEQSRLPPIPVLEDSPASSASLWETSQVEKVENTHAEEHPFIKDLNAGVDTTKKEYSFESTVRGWGDFMRTQLHPRSIIVGFTRLEDQLEDKVRLYVEECDNLQGFHILSDIDQSFSDVLPFLADEFSSKYRLCFPVSSSIGGSDRSKLDTRTVRTLQNFTESATHSSLTVPLSCTSSLAEKIETPRNFPNLLYNLTDSYHTSSILASFVNTISLNYRTKNQLTDMSDTLAGLTSRGWKFGCASQQLPFGVPPGVPLQKYLEARSDDEPLWSSLTPGADTADAWYQTLCLRGFADGSVMQQYLDYLSSSVSSLCHISTPMPTLAPFPKIFSPHVSMKGSVDMSANRVSGFEVGSVPTLAGLHAGPGVGAMLSELTQASAKVNLHRLSHIEVEYDLYQEYLDKMKTWSKEHSNQLDID